MLEVDVTRIDRFSYAVQATQPICLFRYYGMDKLYYWTEFKKKHIIDTIGTEWLEELELYTEDLTHHGLLKLSAGNQIYPLGEEYKQLRLEYLQACRRYLRWNSLVFPKYHISKNRIRFISMYGSES